MISFAQSQTDFGAEKVPALDDVSVGSTLCSRREKYGESNNLTTTTTIRKTIDACSITFRGLRSSGDAAGL